jgi:hypothetical protein
MRTRLVLGVIAILLMTPAPVVAHDEHLTYSQRCDHPIPKSFYHYHGSVYWKHYVSGQYNSGGYHYHVIEHWYWLNTKYVFAHSYSNGCWNHPIG